MQEFAQWSQSMHAQAADDPVFLAMNKRGQRETNGKLGTFCVQCHAPMAVRDGLTTNGLNLAKLDPAYKGVTCFFCHSIDGLEADGGKDNAAVHLADDLVMRGEITDPQANAIHASKYSTFQDSTTIDSASMCGYCHDIDSPAGAHIERTFAEWSETPFALAGDNGGQTCASLGTCHMKQTPGVAVALGGPTNRTLHAHNFPAVDVPLGPKPPDPVAVQAAQAELNDRLLAGSLCVFPESKKIQALLDNNAGHDWPSGAAQDRRAWVEIKAYADGETVPFYTSGVVPAGTPVTATASTDPDLWLLRDCMFDSQNKETHNFCEAQTHTDYGSELPPLKSPTDATGSAAFINSSYIHVWRYFPQTTKANPTGQLQRTPAKVTMRVLLQPVGLDVLNDLVDSGDLDPGPDGAVLTNMPTYEVSLLSSLETGPSEGLEWPAPPDEVDAGLVQPPASLETTDLQLGKRYCTATTGFIVVPDISGTSAATCTPPAP